MLKRKSEGGGDESAGKKNQTGIASESSTQPIPRHLPEKSVTLHFKRTTWEEFAPGKLYYLPTCVNPKYMFNENMREQFNKFKGLWETMTISAPHTRVSNLIFLQDDLRVQSNTPTDATAFTQVCYLVHFAPAAQTEYFQFGNLAQREGTKYTPLQYTLQPEEDKQFTLIGEREYESFDKLLTIPARINKYAGWNPSDTGAPKSPYSYTKPYISPRELDGIVSCNLQVENSDAYFLHSNKVLAYAQDQDYIKFFKYGDTIDLGITTNLEGTKLYKDRANDFLNESVVVNVETGTDKVTYDTEFMYPGNNRPVLCRCYNFDPQFSCINHNKDFKPLKHHFFTMPPIKKPNGALLGQRCSVLVESTMTVTFNFHESTFEGLESDQDINIMAQNDAVMIRRGIYGTVESGGKPPPTITGGILCPYGFNCDNEGGICEYENNWSGFTAYICDTNEATTKQILTTYTVKPEDATSINTFEIDGFGGFTKENCEELWPKGSTQLYEMLEKLRIPEKYIYFFIPSNVVLYSEDATDDEGKLIRYNFPIYLEDFYNNPCVEKNRYWRVNQVGRGDIWVRLSTKALADAIAVSPGITCAQQAPPIQRTDYRNTSKIITTFFK